MQTRPTSVVVIRIESVVDSSGALCFSGGLQTVPQQSRFKARLWQLRQLNEQLARGVWEIRQQCTRPRAAIRAAVGKESRDAREARE